MKTFSPVYENIFQCLGTNNFKMNRSSPIWKVSENEMEFEMEVKWQTWIYFPSPINSLSFQPLAKIVFEISGWQVWNAQICKEP